jgi:amphi-Trp domain-containing protein
MSEKGTRDVEKVYSTKQFISKLRRLADALEQDDRFSIQVAGERIYVPKHATISIEHERSEDTEELEFQIKWSLREEEEGEEEEEEEEEGEEE